MTLSLKAEVSLVQVSSPGALCSICPGRQSHPARFRLSPIKQNDDGGGIHTWDIFACFDAGLDRALEPFHEMPDLISLVVGILNVPEEPYIVDDAEEGFSLCLLTKLRTAHGWSQRELARRAGVSHGQIGDWETGGRPNPRSIGKLAAAFGMLAA